MTQSSVRFAGRACLGIDASSGDTATATTPNPLAGRGRDGLLLVSPSRLRSRRVARAPPSLSEISPAPGRSGRPPETAAHPGDVSQVGSDRQDADHASAGTPARRYLARRVDDAGRRKAKGDRRAEVRVVSTESSPPRCRRPPPWSADRTSPQRSCLFPRCRCRRLRPAAESLVRRAQQQRCIALHASKPCTRGAFNSRIMLVGELQQWTAKSCPLMKNVSALLEQKGWVEEFYRI